MHSTIEGSVCQTLHVLQALWAACFNVLFDCILYLSRLLPRIRTLIIFEHFLLNALARYVQTYKARQIYSHYLNLYFPTLNAKGPQPALQEGGRSQLKHTTARYLDRAAGSQESSVGACRFSLPYCPDVSQGGPSIQIGVQIIFAISILQQVATSLRVIES